MADFFATRPVRERRQFSLARGRIPRGLRVTWSEPSQEAELPNVDLYEYLVGHELFLVDPPGFHICTAHAAARDAIAGELRPDFRCPVGRGDCPLRNLLALAPGKCARFAAAEVT